MNPQTEIIADLIQTLPASEQEELLAHLQALNPASPSSAKHKLPKVRKPSRREQVLALAFAINEETKRKC